MYRRARGQGCLNGRYNDVSTEDLKAMPVEELAAKDSVLLLWVTMPKLDHAFGLMEAWGFDYKTCFLVWVKTNTKTPSNFFGVGSYTASNAEMILVGLKRGGRFSNIKAKQVSQIVETADSPVVKSPRLGHSQKPEVFRDRIDAIIQPHCRKLELFARCSANPEWYYFGNEVEKYSGKTFGEITEMLQEERIKARKGAGEGGP